MLFLKHLVSLTLEGTQTEIERQFNNDNMSFVWFDRPGESSPEKDCCW